ncbi:adenosine deaminase [Chloroflexus sp.]|uniref:adenosine deaminase n=1 Tax=Chloroflexus sp. TaxID=1904827 RepID=UPI002630AE06|nr:adenosine deaminase [uncultured Chloroflexus sp.]
MTPPASVSTSQPARDPAPIARDLPPIDLHRHLDGNVRLTTILELARAYGIRLPADNVEELRPHAQIQDVVASVMDFIARFALLKLVCVAEDAVARIAEENVEDTAREGIDYIELRCSPACMGERYGLDPTRVLAAVCRGVKAGMARYPVQVQIIGIMSRHLGEESYWRELEAAIALMGEGVIGIDLAGDEANFPGTRFVRHFARARAAGLRITVYAGEAAGAWSVRQAIEELGAERIGHGARASEDPAVMRLIAERGITLEVCPTSNVQTQTVPDYARHPPPQLLRAGQRVTLNSDDPGISAIDLPHEYRVARNRLGLTTDELRTIQANALAAAFIDDVTRARLLAIAQKRAT